MQYAITKVFNFQIEVVTHWQLFFATFAIVCFPANHWHIRAIRPSVMAFNPTFITDDFIFRFTTTLKANVKMTKTRAPFRIFAKI